jgi:hypothetical protein
MRAVLALVWSVLSLSSPRHAWAEPPDTEDEAVRPTLREPLDRDGARARLALDLSGAVALSDDRSEVSLGVLLRGTFEDLFVPVRLGGGASLAKEVDDERTDAADAPTAAPAPPRAIDGARARGAVRAALAAAGSAAAAERLDDLSTRARASGAIPELRLRVARVVDEGQALAPTEYDPDRVTATGGTSLWLEGRATFQLDRLVFASDELAVERLRIDRAKLERELAAEVVEALGEYERASESLSDEGADRDARLRAEIELAVASAKLDVLTNGWFSENAVERPGREALGRSKERARGGSRDRVAEPSDDGRRGGFAKGPSTTTCATR